MGLDFLRNHGAHRMRNYAAQLFLLDNGLMDQTELESAEKQADMSYEAKRADDWKPKDIYSSSRPLTWAQSPIRFIDGKDVGRTIAWLQTRQGHPVPVRLSQIGAVVLRNIYGELRREFCSVERVVSLIADPFPWDEIESFAIALGAHGFRLLLSNRPEDGYSYDFERMRKTTQNRSNDEMLRLERQALIYSKSTPTVVDGRLEPREEAFDDENDLIIGLIKTHQKNYLHSQGWQVFYELRPGQRTPAFQFEGEKNGLKIVSWYLRLDGDRGDLPNWGIIRLEIPQYYFENRLSQDWRYIDHLSQVIYEYRSRDQGYGRASVSIHPIQRAEESLGALFTEADMLINQFYHLTHL
jgi:hypothetical protein